MSARDRLTLKSEIELKTAIDLTTPDDVKKFRELSLLEEIGVKYFNIPFRPDIPNYYEKELALYNSTKDMGVFYLGRISYASFAARLIQTLEIIADPKYHPVLFHCGAGKDRTGVLAAMVLNALGVPEEDIINDYMMTDASMAEIRDRIMNNPITTDEVRNLPDFHWSAAPEFMKTFLAGLKQEYNGTAGYLKKYGADKTLIKRLEKALLA